MPNVAALHARFARRPLLLEPMAAQSLVERLTAADPRELVRESRFDALVRRVMGGRGRPTAMDDDDGDGGRLPPAKPACYSPMWAQQAYGEPEDEGLAWSLYQGVALIEIATALSDRGEYFCGVWYHGYDSIKAAITDALGDSRVKAVFIRLASPGGVVSGGLYALSAWLRTVRGQGKPIHVYADMMASAAYWSFAPADRITAPKVGLVGSIGAVLVHVSQKGALEKAGYVVTPIQFGAQKTAGASWDELSPAAKTALQAEIDEIGHDFCADVALSRPQLTAEALIATEAAVFNADSSDAARSGLKIGFVDAIEDEEEAFQSLLKALANPVSVPASGSHPLVAAQGTRADQTSNTEGLMADKKALKAEKTALQAALAAIPASATALRDATSARIAAIKAEMPDDEDEEADDQDGEQTTPKKSPSTKKAVVDPVVAQAVLDLPEAKGREALARKLAFRPGMTTAEAKEMLEAAPQAQSGFLERMGQTDAPNLGTGGGKPSSQAQAPFDAYAARAAAVREAGLRR